MTFAASRSGMLNAPTKLAGSIHGQQHVLAPLLHQLRRLGGQTVRRDRQWLARHHTRHLDIAHVTYALEQPPQVAVREDARQLPALIDHRRYTDLFARDFVQRIHHAGVAADNWNLRLGSHHVAHVGQQLAAQRPARMSARKVFRPEAACIEARDRQCVSHRQHCRGRRCRGEIQRASFLLDAHIDVHVRQFCKRGG